MLKKSYQFKTKTTHEILSRKTKARSTLVLLQKMKTEQWENESISAYFYKYIFYTSLKTLLSSGIFFRFEYWTYNTEELTQYRHLPQYQVRTCLFKNTATTQIFINSCINVKAATLHKGIDAKYEYISSSDLFIVKSSCWESTGSDYVDSLILDKWNSFLFSRGEFFKTRMNGRSVRVHK